MAVAQRVNLDWLRDPPPTNLTPYQTYIRDVDWSCTTAGPIATWSRELKQMVRFLVADKEPRILYWGLSRTVIYNEAYIPLVGAKHPYMQGKNASDVFPEFWAFFENLITRQQSTGECLSGDAEMLLMERHGFLEETYFDWKLVPVIGDDGEVKGSLGCPSDKTWDIIAARRRDCVKHVARQIGRTTSLKHLWAATLDGLSINEKDTPFALLYTVKEQMSLTGPPSRPNYTCRLEGSIGVSSDHAVAKEYLDAQYDLDGFAPKVLAAITADEMLVLKADDPQVNSLLNGISWKGHGLPSHELVIVPLKADDEIAAFFIIGLNPYRRYNKLYQDFLRSLADVMGPQISKLILAEEVQRRAEIARKAESDFAQSELRFARFAERSTFGLAVAGRDKHITYANEAWYSFVGMDPARSDYGGWLETVHDEDIPLVLEWWERVLVDKKGGQFQYRSKVPFRQGNMYSEHRTALCAELKWVEEQLKIRTKALEESEYKWKHYAEHCPLGIVRTDGEGHVLYGNDAWHAYYGFTRGKVPGAQPWLPYVDEGCLEAWAKVFRSLQTEPGAKTHELKLKNQVYTVQEGDHVIQNGVYILITGFSEFKADGTCDYIDFWVTGDISAQKMAAKILADKMHEAIRLKTHQERFIDMISHEIRNPLSAVLHCGEEVIGAMKTCLDNIQPLVPQKCDGRTMLVQQMENALEAANTIMYCVQHQKQIVDDVLTLSKLDADLLVVSPVPVHAMVFHPELKMTDITLSVIEDDSLPEQRIGWVLLDPNRFLQIVINLVTNAIKFTRTARTRKINIVVSASRVRPTGAVLGVHYVPRRYEPATPTSPSGDLAGEFSVSEEVFLSFQVTDTGKGLSPDEEALLFNRFAQASPKTHIEYGGSGLGLFISRQITEMLDGEIGMSSSGVGSTFAFYVKTQKAIPPRRPSVSIEPILELTRTLSLNSSASPMVVPPSPNDEAAGTIDVTLVTPPDPDAKLVSSVERHVLVVEDNLVNQKVLCKMLRNRNFIVKAANHGREALEAIQMPVMDGIDFTKEVRSQESTGQMQGHVPIVGVTANVRSQQVSAAIEAGMDGVTTKPYRIDELIAHINRVCSLLAAVT
ncbi:hypothetical protein TruAng_001563 [Truncatella angustata]|nr:hypothetical protein TruAng_001563 [Truncatella angustata]